MTLELKNKNYVNLCDQYMILTQQIRDFVAII